MYHYQVFGVCCNNTVPDVLPEEPKNEEAIVDDENEAIVDDSEFPIEGQSFRRSCGFRSINNNLLVRPAPLPTVTLYNQSPNPALNLYRALLPTSYIVNGEQAQPHEFPWMVGDQESICVTSSQCIVSGCADESAETILRRLPH